MKTVERTTGYEGGTGRSSGFAFLRRVLEHTFFAELIDVRTVIGAP
jgi:tryptophan 2,3-dioxygenase